MATEATTIDLAVRPQPVAGRLQEAIRSAFYIGVREVRIVLRAPADFMPGLFIPVFFYFINVASLSKFASSFGISNFKGFLLPIGLLFAASNGGAGLNMVTDIDSGYFEKLLLTPISRLALLVGAMGADLTRILVQSAIVIAIALAAGARVETGVTGAAALILMASLWGLAYSAIGFAIALKTGSPAATQSAWVIFFPLVFLTTSFAPKEALAGWLSTAADYNPVTYVLRGMRAFTVTGWNGHEILIGLLAIVGFGAVTMTLAFRALLGRVR